jgi:hypothetical protein
VIPPTPTTFQSTQSEIEWHAPPTANLVPQTAQVTSPVTKNSAPVASNRVVLSDEPASGRQVEGLGKVVPTVEIISDTVSSRKTTNQRQLAQPAQPGNRVYKGDISTTDANLAPGTDVAAQNRPVIMNISSPPPALESTDTKPAQVSFSDKPGFTILKPMYEASEASEKSRLQKSNRRQPTGIRISDTNSGESNESQIQIR